MCRSRPTHSGPIVANSETIRERRSEKLSNRFAFSLVLDCGSCIIRSGAKARSSEFWQKRKIPPPSSLDGRVGRRSPSEGLNTSGSYKLDARTVKAVGLPSPRNPTQKLIKKQR